MKNVKVEVPFIVWQVITVKEAEDNEDAINQALDIAHLDHYVGGAIGAGVSDNIYTECPDDSADQFEGKLEASVISRGE